MIVRPTTIFDALQRLDGRATPPAIRELLGLRVPEKNEPDMLVALLEVMRQRGELAVEWVHGNGVYTLARGR